MMVLFYLSGAEIGGIMTVLHNFGVNPDNAEGVPDMGNNDFYKTLFGGVTGLLVLAGAVGLGIALATQSPAENYLMVPLITTHLVVFVDFMINVYQYMMTSAEGNLLIKGVTLLIFVPLIIGYLISLFEFFRASD